MTQAISYDDMMESLARRRDGGKGSGNGNGNSGNNGSGGRRSSTTKTSVVSRGRSGRRKSGGTSSANSQQQRSSNNSSSSTPKTNERSSIEGGGGGPSSYSKYKSINNANNSANTMVLPSRDGNSVELVDTAAPVPVPVTTTTMFRVDSLNEGIATKSCTTWPKVSSTKKSKKFIARRAKNFALRQQKQYKNPWLSSKPNKERRERIDDDPPPPDRRTNQNRRNSSSVSTIKTSNCDSGKGSSGNGNTNIVGESDNSQRPSHINSKKYAEREERRRRWKSAEREELAQKQKEEEEQRRREEQQRRKAKVSSSANVSSPSSMKKKTSKAIKSRSNGNNSSRVSFAAASSTTTPNNNKKGQHAGKDTNANTTNTNTNNIVMRYKVDDANFGNLRLMYDKTSPGGSGGQNELFFKVVNALDQDLNTFDSLEVPCIACNQHGHSFDQCTCTMIMVNDNDDGTLKEHIVHLKRLLRRVRRAATNIGVADLNVLRTNVKECLTVDLRRENNDDDDDENKATEDVEEERRCDRDNSDDKATVAMWRQKQKKQPKQRRWSGDLQRPGSPSLIQLREAFLRNTTMIGGVGVGVCVGGKGNRSKKKSDRYAAAAAAAANDDSDELQGTNFVDDDDNGSVVDGQGDRYGVVNRDRRCPPIGANSSPGGIIKKNKFVSSTTSTSARRNKATNTNTNTSRPTNVDAELLMGLEMHKQLSSAFHCGSGSGTTTRSTCVTTDDIRGDSRNDDRYNGPRPKHNKNTTKMTAKLEKTPTEKRYHDNDSAATVELTLSASSSSSMSCDGNGGFDPYGDKYGLRTPPQKSSKSSISLLLAPVPRSAPPKTTGNTTLDYWRDRYDAIPGNGYKGASLCDDGFDSDDDNENTDTDEDEGGYESAGSYPLGARRRQKQQDHDYYQSLSSPLSPSTPLRKYLPLTAAYNNNATTIGR